MTWVEKKMDVDKQRISNDNGLRVMGVFEDLRQEIRSIDAKCERIAAEFEAQNKQNEQRMAVLENEMLNLRMEGQDTREEESAFDLRRRLFDGLKRDIMKPPHVKKTDAIKDGNDLAPRGDALTDALLFEKDNRKDHSIYLMIYGLRFETVLKYGIKSLLHILERMNKGSMVALLMS
ncbi:hypothetical protein ACLMJK_009314 [Lecanora helva]